MNRTAALDRDRAAASSPASTANRMTATESLLPEIINDFFNKICHEETHAPQHTAAYSITSLAKASNVGGIVSPSAFAVFMLITSSNLVACSTGKSAGLAPFSILSM